MSGAAIAPGAPPEQLHRAKRRPAAPRKLPAPRQRENRGTWRLSQMLLVNVALMSYKFGAA